MKIKKISPIILSVFLLSSCSDIKYDVENLSFNEAKLIYKDFSDVYGHHYKHKTSELNEEIGNKCLNLYKYIWNNNNNKTDITDADGFDGSLCYNVQFKSDKNYNIWLNFEDKEISCVYLKVNIIIDNELEKYKLYSYKMFDENTKKMIDEIELVFESTLKDVEWTY